MVGQQSLADRTRAPAGKHTAWAYTHGPQGLDWAGEQERHVERMEAQVERFAPGFRKRILARHVLGPAELQARNANLVGGDVAGAAMRWISCCFARWLRRSRIARRCGVCT
jgi:phytoene dehydrogenase-like protein